MFDGRYIRKIICITTVLCLLTGCGYVEPLPQSGDGAEEEITTLGLTPEFNYEVPESLPNILVDQVGYEQGSNKVAIFRGEMPPDTFLLIDAETEQVVYTGRIESKGYDEATGDFISYGDFTDFDTPGTYYIEAAMVGRSYFFCIADEAYTELFHAALKQYYLNRCGVTLSSEHAGEAARNACHMKEAQMKETATEKLDVSGGWHVDGNGNRDVLQGCKTINYLLLAYELYPDVFTDDTGIPESGNTVPDVLDEVKYEVDWLLKMQDATSGAVYAAVSCVDSTTTSYILYIDGITMSATIQFAAAMAKFSYLYQGYDREFATICLKASDRAYRYVEQYLSDVSQEEYFHAAAELYRATGSYRYHNAVKDYLTANPDIDIDNDFVFWGIVTYLSTKQRVDVNLCNSVIQILMREAEQISYASKNSKLLVNIGKGQGNGDELLRDITRLAVVDHIITNHEYTTVLENHLHYFLGRNLMSVSYLDNAGTRNYMEIDESMGIMKQVDSNAKLILMMSAVLGNEKE